MAFSVQLHAREDFEVRTLRALGGAAVLAPLVALGEWLHVRVDVAFIALVGAGLASARVGWKTWVALAVGLPALLCLPELLRMPWPATQVLMGVLAAGGGGPWDTGGAPPPAPALAPSSRWACTCAWCSTRGSSRDRRAPCTPRPDWRWWPSSGASAGWRHTRRCTPTPSRPGGPGCRRG